MPLLLLFSCNSRSAVGLRAAAVSFNRTTGHCSLLRNLPRPELCSPFERHVNQPVSCLLPWSSAFLRITCIAPKPSYVHEPDQSLPRRFSKINLRDMYVCQSFVSQPCPKSSKKTPELPTFLSFPQGDRCLFHPPISYFGPVLPADDLLNKVTISCSWTYPKSSEEFLHRPDLSILPQGDMSVVHSLDSQSRSELLSVGSLGYKTVSLGHEQ